MMILSLWGGFGLLAEGFDFFSFREGKLNIGPSVMFQSYHHNSSKKMSHPKMSPWPLFMKVGAPQNKAFSLQPKQGAPSRFQVLK